MTSTSAPRLRRLALLALAASLAARPVEPRPALVNLEAGKRPAPRGPAAEGQSDASQLTVALFKNIVGAGAFALPAGMASGTGLVPAVASTLFFGYVSMWTFFLLGDAARRTRSSSYAELWSRTVGRGTAWVADGCIVAMSFGSCVQFTATIVLLLHELLGRRLPPRLAGRRPLVVAATLAMLPLCIARNLRSLAWSSTAGVLGVVYGAAFVVWRLLDRLRDGARAAAAAPMAVGAPLRLGWSTFALMGALNTVYLAHFNVPRFWCELDTADIDDFRRVCARAFGAAALLYVVVMVGGYLTFGEACRGRFLIDLYPTDDAGALVLRAATLVSVAGGYPLAFIALRDSAETLLGQPDRRRPSPHQPPPGRAPLSARGRLGLTLGLVLAVGAAAVYATDISLIISLRGALLGSVIVFLLPALVGWSCDRALLDSLYHLTAGQWLRRQALYAALIGYGAVSSVLGTAVCVRDALRAARTLA